MNEFIQWRNYKSQKYFMYKIAKNYFCFAPHCQIIKAVHYFYATIWRNSL